MTSKRTNLVLGITGSIATGKSTVAKMFEYIGAASVSADLVARQVLAPGSKTSREVISALGAGVALGNSVDEVDRSALGALIYSDPNVRKLVGEIMHPPIHAILSEQIESAKHDPQHNLVIAEIPLLFENKLESFVDKILVVSCGEETQISRIVARQPGLPPEEAVVRIHSQLPLSQKIELADFVIDTDQSLVDVRNQVEHIHATLAS